VESVTFFGPDQVVRDYPDGFDFFWSRLCGTGSFHLSVLVLSSCFGVLLVIGIERRLGVITPTRLVNNPMASYYSAY